MNDNDIKKLINDFPEDEAVVKLTKIIEDSINKMPKELLAVYNVFIAKRISTILNDGE